MTFTKMTGNFQIGGNIAGSDNEIDHCDFGTFYPSGGWPNFRGATIQHGSQFNYIHDNKIHDWQKYDWDPNNQNYDGPVCLEIGEEEGTDPTSYNVIENNLMYHCGHHVFGMAGRYNVFRKNIVHNEDYWVGPAIGTFAPNETTYASRNIYGYRNLNLTSGMSGQVGNHLIEDNRIGPSGISTHSWYADGSDNITDIHQRGGTSFYINSSNNTIRYNALYGSVGKGAYFRAYAPGGQVIHNYLYNNTFYSSVIA